jgi:hypothetical protein
MLKERQKRGGGGGGQKGTGRNLHHDELRIILLRNTLQIMSLLVALSSGHVFTWNHNFGSRLHGAVCMSAFLFVQCNQGLAVTDPLLKELNIVSQRVSTSYISAFRASQNCIITN